VADVARLPPIIRGLLRPEAYPHPAHDLELHETHVSWVVLAGPYAYKLKKPVTLGFVDFSTFARRAANCEAEVQLNRRMAPDVYLGVVDVVERDGEIRVGGPGRVLERAVWMRRLPAEGMLSRLLAREEATPALIRRIARMVARFHATAATGPGVDEYGDRSNIDAHWQGNLREIEPYLEVTLPSWELKVIRRYVGRFLDANDRLFTRRIATHRVRDGHGDLHSNSICLVDDRIVAFDCIEFAAGYRCGDVAAEVAFLSMDLDHAGRADLGWIFVDEYVRRSSDSEVGTLLDFYKCYRAFVRGKVLSLRLAEASLPDPTRQEITAEARAYFDLAFAYAGGAPRPLILVTCGLPGTGKTTLARTLARRLALVPISTDVVRKQLARLAPTEHPTAAFGAGLYTPEMTRRTYAAVRALGARWLRRGVSVVLDGTFAEARQRALVRRMATRLGAHVLFVLTQADDATVRARLETRAADPTNVSDATWEVYQQLRDCAPFQPDAFEPFVIDRSGGSDPESVVASIADLYNR